MRESLDIGGWVAMWRPMEIYLYDWWTLRGRGRTYTQLSQMPVEVIRRRGELPPTTAKRERHYGGMWFGIVLVVGIVMAAGTLLILDASMPVD